MWANNMEQAVRLLLSPAFRDLFQDDSTDSTSTSSIMSALSYRYVAPSDLVLSYDSWIHTKALIAQDTSMRELAFTFSTTMDRMREWLRESELAEHARAYFEGLVSQCSEHGSESIRAAASQQLLAHAIAAYRSQLAFVDVYSDPVFFAAFIHLRLAEAMCASNKKLSMRKFEMCGIGAKATHPEWSEDETERTGEPAILDWTYNSDTELEENRHVTEWSQFPVEETQTRRGPQAVEEEDHPDRDSRTFGEGHERRIESPIDFSGMLPDEGFEPQDRDEQTMPWKMPAPEQRRYTTRKASTSGSQTGCACTSHIWDTCACAPGVRAPVYDDQGQPTCPGGEQADAGSNAMGTGNAAWTKRNRRRVSGRNRTNWDKVRVDNETAAANKHSCGCPVMDRAESESSYDMGF